VAPGEEYKFTGIEAVSEGKRTLVDAAVAERKQSEGTGGKRWGWILGILVAVAIAATGVYLLFLGPSGERLPRGDKTVDTGAKPDAGAAAQGELQERYQAALARFKQNDFEGAVSGFKAVVDGNPNYQDAQARLEEARQELQNAKLWAQANEEMNKSNPDRAMELIDQISKVTVLEKEIAQLRPTLKRNFISFHLNKAQRSRDQGLPEEAKRHLNAVAKVDSNAIPIDLRQSVERMLQAKPKPENGAKEPAPKEPAPKEPAPKKPVASRQQKATEAKDLVGQGVQLVKEGKPAEAVTLFLKAKELDPSNCSVYKNLGIAYANLSNGPKQIYYYQKFLDVCPNDPMAPKVRDILSRMPANKTP
jgi:tetratricopeptide (TPR) repeat protein